MMGGISTHVLDTASGRPAAGVRIDFSAFENGQWRPIKSVTTNPDGRTDEPLLSGSDMRTGEYRLDFHVGDYYRGLGLVLPEPAFIDCVPLQFGVAQTDGHYHVPLLCTPWSYSTYRGS